MSLTSKQYKRQARRIKGGLFLLGIETPDHIGRSELRAATIKYYKQDMSYLEAFDQLEHLIRTNQKEILEKIMSVGFKKSQALQKRIFKGSPPVIAPIKACPDCDMKTVFSPDFYVSERWRRLRYQAIIKYGRRCMCCGRTTEQHGIVIHVDHIKPRSKHPELAFSLDNLQILCEDCNLGKSNIDDTDFRF